MDSGTVPGPDYDQFHVTEDPSRGEYSLAHATGSRYLTPATGLTVEPPVQVDLWLQLEFGSGIQMSFGRPDADHPRYVVALQYNANGNVVRIDEVTGDGRDVQKGTFPDFPVDEWTKFTVTWAADGTFEATYGDGEQTVSRTFDGDRPTTVRSRGLHVQ